MGFGIKTLVGKFLSTKAGSALFMVMGALVVVGGIAYKYERDAHLEDNERLSADVERAKGNADKFENLYNEGVAEATALAKEARATKVSNDKVLKAYAESNEDLKKKEAKYQKRLKQYERVFIEKPELYARSYALFYGRGLRKLEKLTRTCGEDCSPD